MISFFLNCIIITLFVLTWKYLTHFFPYIFYRNPNGENITEWPSYDMNNKRYIVIDNPIHTSENLKPRATDLLRRITEIGRQRMEPAVSSANILHNVKSPNFLKDIWSFHGNLFQNGFSFIYLLCYILLLLL